MFRELAPGGKTLCLMVAGSPDPANTDCAFPPALLTDAAGEPLPEPLAADVRPEADGKRGALLKIVAGLLAVGIDDLKQRDQQRKVRFLSALAVGSLAIAFVTIGLAINTHYARKESDLRRTQAEELIGFMLVDLREKLQPIGKLDILDAVGDQAMEYFEALGDELSDEDALARVMALRQIGEVRFNQGQLESALTAFAASRDYVRSLHDKSSEQNEYLFELGQAEFWVGYVAWERSDLPGAEVAFSAYRDASVELARRDPNNAGYTRELLYAASNLGSVAREAGESAVALHYFADAVEINEQLIEQSPDDPNLRYDLAEGLSWMGSALRDLGDLSASEEMFQRSREIFRSLHDLGVHARHSEGYGDVLSLLADLQVNRGEIEKAQNTLDTGILVFVDLVGRDNENSRWQTGLCRLNYLKASLLASTGRSDQASDVLELAHDGFLELTANDPSNMDLQQRLARTEALTAIIDVGAGRLAQATARSNAAWSRSDKALRESSRPAKLVKAAVEVLDIRAEILASNGETARAHEAWSDALDLLGPVDPTDPVNRALYLRLMQRLGRADEVEAIAADLTAIGFGDPRYLLSQANF